MQKKNESAERVFFFRLPPLRMSLIINKRACACAFGFVYIFYFLASFSISSLLLLISLIGASMSSITGRDGSSSTFSADDRATESSFVGT